MICFVLRGVLDERNAKFKVREKEMSSSNMTGEVIVEN